MERLLSRLAALGTHRPRTVIAGAFLAAALAAGFAAGAMRVETDLTRFLPDAPAVRAFGEARELVREAGTLWALFTASDDGRGRDPGDALLAYAGAWATSLREAGVAASVEYEVPPLYEKFVRTVLARKGFLYLDGADLDEALSRLEDGAIRAQIAEAAARIRSAAPVQLARLTAADPLGLISIFSRRLTRGLGAFRLDATSGYMLSTDRRALLAKVVGKGAPGDLAYARDLFAALAEAEARGRAAAPGVEVGYTGGYAFAVEDERSIRRDVYLTVATSALAVLGIFVIAFRRGRAFVYASAPIAVGVAVGFAVYVAVRRDVTVAAAAFVSVVVGLAVDFPIHLLARYLRERKAGRPLEAANEAAVVSAGGGAVAAGLMTGAAFLSFAATGFRGLADLGIMAGSCMIASLAATLVLFPALTAAIGPADERAGLAGFGLAALWRAIVRRPEGIVAGGAIATLASVALLAGTRGGAVSLESDLRNVRPEGARALEVQEEIARRFGGSFEVALALFHAPSEAAVLEALARARAGLDRLRETGAVAGYETPERYLPAPGRQEAALARLARVDPARVEATLRAALVENGFKLAPFEAAFDLLRAQLRPEGPVRRATLEAAGLGGLLDPLAVRPDGRAVALVTVFPRPGEPAGEVARALRAELAERGVEVEVTGIAVVLETLVAALRRDFIIATAASLALCLAIALVHFRRPAEALLATLPVVVGFLWMLAFMKAVGLSVNFMNVIVFPMVIGIEDNAVHVLHRWRERRRAGAGGIESVLGDTGLALFLCTATTMLGFGSLVLSSNRGLASIGAVTLVAKTTCWISSTMVLPALLALAERRGGRPAG